MYEMGTGPHKGYKVFKVFHKKEGRWYAVLTNGEKDRTTKSWARYLMEKHLCRTLEKHEHVDHINNIKSDDRIENLQILAPDDNNHKFLDSAPSITVNCSVCNKKFDKTIVGFRKNGNHNCSKACEQKAYSQNLLNKPIKHGTSVAYAHHKCRCDLCKEYKRNSRKK